MTDQVLHSSDDFDAAPRRSRRLARWRPLPAAAGVVLVADLACAAGEDDRFPRPVPPAAVRTNPPAAPGWSGEPGSSGHPLMTPSAILAATANFKNCLEGLWPAAA